LAGRRCQAGGKAHSRQAGGGGRPMAKWCQRRGVTVFAVRRTVRAAGAGSRQAAGVAHPKYAV